uniref:uncharacterized protein LOC122607941 isoform X2 n=1 Tax=Erigeron canadensis TaxID=72917 RepID=UPI001CB9154C|nr:uncharacterized protein LOC122607941 isoform X2 [Erigeron canadensis]
MLPLFRAENALNFTLVYQISKSLPYFQKCYSCGGMNNNYKVVGGNSNKRTADMKKQNTDTSLRRPFSKQSCSADVKGIEVESQVKVHAGSSSGVLNSQDGHGGAKHSISLKVGPSLFRFIKGKGGSVQQNIEEEMGVRIIFPSSRTEESIIIEGTSPDSLARASERIQLIIDEAVKSPALDYSHFISLPLAINPQLIHKLVNFQNSILGISYANPDEVPDYTFNKDSTSRDGGSKKLDKVPQVAVTLKTQKDSQNVNMDVTKIPLVSYPAKSSTASSSKPKASTLSELGIDKSIFINPKTFHLTVLMLKLWNKERLDAAVRIFKGIEAEVMDALDARPVYIRLKGLDLMRGSLAKARVLYAPVEVVGGEDRLMHACKIITDAFTKGGLVLEKDSKHALKLHATVMNARHRKRTMNTKKFDTFDARGIVEQYGSEEWGEYLIREVHLSQRFVFDKNGYYHCCASVPLPKDVEVSSLCC